MTKLTLCSGDSYTSTGFDIAKSQPSRGNPLGNPAFPGATSSNGPNYISFLTATYNRSFIETYNLGFGGALIDKAIVTSPFGSGVKSFEDQVSQEFQPRYTGSSTTPWKSSDSLFIVFFGINDAINTFAKTDSDNLQYAEIKSYENLVNQVREISTSLWTLTAEFETSFMLLELAIFFSLTYRLSIVRPTPQTSGPQVQRFWRNGSATSTFG